MWMSAGYYGSYDVVVAGGGPAGIVAALAAAREGKRTVLIEKAGFVGGMMMLPLAVLGFLDEHGNQVVEGIPGWVFSELQREGFASAHYPSPRHKSYTIIDPEPTKRVLLDMLDSSGVTVLLHTTVVGTVGGEGRLEGVVVHSKSGIDIITGQTFIDATGDGDLVASGGFGFSISPELQPATLIFRLGNVDFNTFQEWLVAHPEMYADTQFKTEHFTRRHFNLSGLKPLVDEAKKDGLELPISRVVCCTSMRDDEMVVNMTRETHVNGVNRDDLTRAEISTRRQIPLLEQFFRKYVPGFADARVVEASPFIGVRETRVIEGLYTVSLDDVRHGRKFPDSIGYASYFVDMHHGSDQGFTFIFPEQPCQIPLRALIPKGSENLVVAGRTVSSTREALAMLRVIAPCMVMGQAAGALAVVSINENKAFKDIDPENVRSLLRKQGALVD